MSNNILNDISKVYFGKIVSEKLDPVGQEDSDIDNDGKKNTKTDKYLLNRRRKIGSVIKTRKESFSNWRDDLFEIADLVDNEQNKKQIKEKKVNNKVEINPKMNTEMIQIASELGGELIEMVEIGEETDYEREEKLRRRRQKLLKLQAKRKPISREKSDTLTKSSDEIIKSLRKEEIDSQSKKPTQQEPTSQKPTSQKPTPQELNLVRKQQQFKINALKQGKLPLHSEEYELDERHMTSVERRKEEALGKKTSSAKKAMMKQYGAEKGEKIYYAWKRKKAMNEESKNIYNYVIETLIDNGFAENFNFAENIVEHMSDAWLESIIEGWKTISKGAINQMSGGKGLGSIKTGDTLNKARYTHKKGEKPPSSTDLRKRLEAQAAEAGSPKHRGQTGGMSREYSAAAADAMMGNDSGPAAKALKAGDTSKARPHTQYYLDQMKKSKRTTKDD
jgi:hypothetical protein